MRLLQGQKSSDSAVPEDYRKIRLDAKQLAAYYAAAFAVLFLLGLLFYRSAVAGLIACLAAFPLKTYYSRLCLDKRREELLDGFRDALYSMSSSLASGRQMPSAVELAAESVANTRGPGSIIAKELSKISREYEFSHADMGQLLEDFGKRSGIEEIEQFASAFRTCQLCGGNLEDVCLKSSALILDRIAARKQVKSLVSEKKLDIILLSIMPAAVLLILNVASYSYVAVLYESIAGRMVMSVCLLLMVLALIWGLKIIKIEL